MAPTGGAPVVDRRGLGATRAQDDPLARRLRQRAQGAMQKWPEGFRGFQARVRVRADDPGARAYRIDAKDRLRLEECAEGGRRRAVLGRGLGRQALVLGPDGHTLR